MSADGFIEVLDTLPYGDLYSDSVHGILKLIVPGNDGPVKFIAPMPSEMPEDLYEKFLSDVADIWRHRTGCSIRQTSTETVRWQEL